MYVTCFQAQAASTFQTTTTPSSTYFQPGSQPSYVSGVGSGAQATPTYSQHSQGSMYNPQTGAAVSAAQTTAGAAYGKGNSQAYIYGAVTLQFWKYNLCQNMEMHKVRCTINTDVLQDPLPRSTHHTPSLPVPMILMAQEPTHKAMGKSRGVILLSNSEDMMYSESKGLI